MAGPATATRTYSLGPCGCCGGSLVGGGEGQPRCCLYGFPGLEPVTPPAAEQSFFSPQDGYPTNLMVEVSAADSQERPAHPAISWLNQPLRTPRVWRLPQPYGRCIARAFLAPPQYDPDDYRAGGVPPAQLALGWTLAGCGPTTYEGLLDPDAEMTLDYAATRFFTNQDMTGYGNWLLVQAGSPATLDYPREDIELAPVSQSPAVRDLNGFVSKTWAIAVRNDAGRPYQTRVTVTLKRQPVPVPGPFAAFAGCFCGGHPRWPLSAYTTLTDGTTTYGAYWAMRLTTAGTMVGDLTTLARSSATPAGLRVRFTLSCAGGWALDAVVGTAAVSLGEAGDPTDPNVRRCCPEIVLTFGGDLGELTDQMPVGWSFAAGEVVISSALRSAFPGCSTTRVPFPGAVDG